MLVACGGGQQAASPTPVANTAPTPAPVPEAKVAAAPTGMAGVLAKLDQFADAICKCTDKACIDQQTQELTKWGQEISKEDHSADKPTDQEAARAAATSQRMSDCMVKVLTPASGAGAKP